MNSTIISSSVWASIRRLIAVRCLNQVFIGGEREAFFHHCVFRFRLAGFTALPRKPAAINEYRRRMGGGLARPTTVSLPFIATLIVSPECHHRDGVSKCGKYSVGGDLHPECNVANVAWWLLRMRERVMARC